MVPVRKVMPRLFSRALINTFYIKRLEAERRDPNHLVAHSYDQLAAMISERRGVKEKAMKRGRLINQRHAA